jgi:hypothetical protein
VGYHKPQPITPKAAGPTAGGFSNHDFPFPTHFFAFQTRLFAAQNLLQKSPDILQIIKW